MLVGFAGLALLPQQLQQLPRAAAFMVPAPAFPHRWQQHRVPTTTTRSPGGGNQPAQQQQQQQQQGGRSPLVAAATTTSTSSTTVPPQQQQQQATAAAGAEPDKSRARPPQSLDELLTEIKANAGTPQVLSLLKDAVAATGTGEVKKEVFKVRLFVVDG